MISANGGHELFWERLIVAIVVIVPKTVVPSGNSTACAID